MTCGRVDEATAYVLGTLSQHQRERFGRHASNCETCSEELELLTAAATAPELMASRPVPPPSEHEQLLDAGRSRDSEYVPGHSAQKRIQSQSNPFGNSARIPKGNRRRLAAPIPKPALVGLLGFLIVAALTVYMSHTAVSTTFARGQTAWPNTSAGIALQIQGSHGELLLNHIPGAPVGQHYEVWYLTAHATRLTKLSSEPALNAQGQAGLQLPGDIHDYTVVGVYPIANGSSTAPRVTDHPVAVVYVPATTSTASAGTSTSTSPTS